MPFGDPQFRTDGEIRALIRAMVLSVPGAGDWMDVWGRTPAWLGQRRAAGRPWWNIRRASVSEAWPDRAINDFQGPEAIQTSRYVLELKFPWSIEPGKESEPRFEALVDAVLAKFRDEPNLGGAVREASLASVDGGETGFVLVRRGDDLLTAHVARFEMTITQIAPRS